MSDYVIMHCNYRVFDVLLLEADIIHGIGSIRE